MGDKLKTWHVNMLKRYFSRDTNAKSLAGSVNEEVVVEKHSDFHCNDLLEFPVVVAKETIDDVTLGSQLSSEQRSELSDVLKDYVFEFSDLPGTIDLVQHKIELISDQPVCSKPYPVPLKLQEKLLGHIKEMLNLGIIRRSDSAYASRIVLVRKKDGINRLCIDYQKLNKMTLFDPQPMTNITDVLEKLNGDKFFFTIDLTKGFWQIPVAADDVYKTAFVTNGGAYEFLKMPFGMINSCATFGRAMRELLRDLKNVDFYIDDVIVHTTTWAEHFKCFEGVITALC